MRTLGLAEFVVVPENESMAEVIRALSKAEVQFAVVVESGSSKLSGIITGGDVVRHIGQSFELQHYLASEAGDYCNADSVTVNVDAISDANAEELKVRRIQYVPVVDDTGEFKSLVEVYP
jgi:CBS domain-containing protein